MTDKKEEKGISGSQLSFLSAAAILLFKYKVFILSFGLSLGLYMVTYGWKFAVMLIVLLYIHEMGHFLVMHFYGLKPKAPVFVPFLGAYVAMTNMPEDKATHAWVAYAGPLIGGGSAILAAYLGEIYQLHFLAAAANYGILLNLLQLVPMKPFDGGFIAQCVAKWLYIPGALVLLGVGYFLDSWFLMLIAGFGIFQAIQEMRQPPGTGSAEASLWQKTLVSAAYVGLAGSLVYFWWQSYVYLEALKATQLPIKSQWDFPHGQKPDQLSIFARSR